ncbi:MAG: hypothetical protein LUD72_14705 [Bacteroidales bacterium]|nr:hypothetical protein [Bacteroidales bacterium]
MDEETECSCACEGHHHCIHIDPSALMTVSIITGGTTSEVVAIPQTHRFTTVDELDEYFTEHEDELVVGTWATVGDMLVSYGADGSWHDFTCYITGPAGASGLEAWSDVSFEIDDDGHLWVTLPSDEG